MKRVAIINQRYGEEVNGGSEDFTRQLAQHLKTDYQIQILTTCAKNYHTWSNDYLAGETTVNGIDVLRFPVKRERNPKWFRFLSRIVRYINFGRKKLEPLWIKAQGPYCPALIEYIQNHQQDYDVFIFVTYLYYGTVQGLPIVSQKSILIPTAHEEPYLQFKIYQKIFRKPKAIIYLTEEEKYYVESVFQNETVKNAVLGMGICIPENRKTTDFQMKYKITTPYLIYAGRIDSAKNCEELFSYFIETQKQRSQKLQLLLIGVNYLEIPDTSEIRYLGFLDENEKYEAISGAVALCLPSVYESFSIAVLEAMALGTPVIVNGKCSVLRAHCEKSKAGMCYYDKTGFETAVGQLSKENIRSAMGKNGQKYVKENYQWNSIIQAYHDIIEQI